jgi:transposase
MMMAVMMNDSNLSSMSQLKNFLSESGGIEFNRKNRKEVYSWIEETLIRFQYAILSKKEKGLIWSYFMKITGYSKAQLGRYITQHRKTGKLRIKEYE